MASRGFGAKDGIDSGGKAGDVDSTMNSMNADGLTYDMKEE